MGTHSWIKLSKTFKTFLQTTIHYTNKQPLMMAYEESVSVRDNFGKFINQFQRETKTIIRKIERILNKLYRQNVSLLFNETCLNERLRPNYTHTHTHTHIYIYICIHIFMYLFILYIQIQVDSVVLDTNSLTTRFGYSTQRESLS